MSAYLIHLTDEQAAYLRMSLYVPLNLISRDNPQWGACAALVEQLGTPLAEPSPLERLEALPHHIWSASRHAGGYDCTVVDKEYHMVVNGNGHTLAAAIEDALTKAEKAQP